MFLSISITSITSIISTDFSSTSSASSLSSTISTTTAKTATGTARDDHCGCATGAVGVTASSIVMMQKDVLSTHEIRTHITRK